MRISDWSSDVCSSDLAVDDHDHVVAVGLPEPHQAEAQHVVGDETVLGDARVWNALGGVERDLAGHGLLLSACMLLHSAIIAAAMCPASAAMVRDGLRPMAQGSTAPSAALRPAWPCPRPRTATAPSTDR